MIFGLSRSKKYFPKLNELYLVFQIENVKQQFLETLEVLRKDNNELDEEYPFLSKDKRIEIYEGFFEVFGNNSLQKYLE